MPRYTVLVREVHVSHRVVEAASPKEAIRRVEDGEGEEEFLEYSDTLNPDKWSVEDDDGQVVISTGEYHG